MSFSSALAAAGRNGDSRVVHASPRTRAFLKAMGGSGTTNPVTGMKEYFTFGGPHADDINNAYMSVFGREADDDGAQWFSNRIQNEGLGLDDVERELRESDEFFVRSQYANNLGRTGGSDPGVDWWVGRLGEGASRDSVADAFRNSPEARGEVSWADADGDRLPDTQAERILYGFEPTDPVRDFLGMGGGGNSGGGPTVRDPLDDFTGGSGGGGTPSPGGGTPSPGGGTPSTSPTIPDLDLSPVTDQLTALTDMLSQQQQAEGEPDYLTRDSFEELFREMMAEQQNARPDYDPLALILSLMMGGGFANDGRMSGYGSLMPTIENNAFVRRAVRDRDTGEMRYVNVPISSAVGGGNMSDFRQQRRNGFGGLAM